MPKYIAATVVDLFFVSAIILSAIAISSADDYRYQACQPRSCGNVPNISFPFYFVDQQEYHCGAPYDGFAVHCVGDESPVLNISGNYYQILNISYEERSMNVRLRGSSSNTACPPDDITSTTLPEYLHYDNGIQDLYLVNECRGLLASRRYEPWCGYQVLLPSEINLIERARRDCSEIVVVPVEGNGDVVANASEYWANGFRLNWTTSDCAPCENSGGRCGYNTTTNHFACFCRDRPHHRTCNDNRLSKRTIIILATTIPGFVLVLFILVLFLFCRQKARIKTRGIHLRNISSISYSSEVEASSLHGIPIFSYKELQEATCNFSDSRELGDGGFGTVYYGKLRDGREVAVKRLYERNHKRLDHFMNEVNTLTCLRHPNLVTLYGCTSRTSRELLLVYEYIPNGTVASHLHGEKSKDNLLPWQIRMEIAVQTASALAYLHKSDIIHRDIKTDNILLDDHFSVKVADFGLSRLFPNDVTHVSTAPQGTPGYVDPEYHQCYQLTDKSDVYSFGVVLIELISSLPAVDITRSRTEINLANLAVNIIRRCALHELIDPRFGYGSDPTVTYMAEAVAELAFQCLHMEKEMRPSMNEILRVLKDIKAGDECGKKWIGFNRNIDMDDACLLSKKEFLDSPKAVFEGLPSSYSTVDSFSGI